MSIRGDQPIPCFQQQDCALAGNGQTYCDDTLRMCQKPPPTGVQPQRPFVQLQTPTPSSKQTTVYSFLFGTTTRANITGLVLMLIAIIVLLL